MSDEWRSSPGLLSCLISGASASIFTDLAMNFWEVRKNRRQASDSSEGSLWRRGGIREALKNAKIFVARFRNFLQESSKSGETLMAVKTCLSRANAGWQMMLPISFFGGAVYFVVYEHVMSSTGNAFVAGMASDVVPSLVTIPFEKTKVRMQASNYDGPRSFHGAIAILKDLYTERRLKGLYHGWQATLLRDCATASLLMGTNKFLVDYFDEWEHTWTFAPLSGAIAGAITNPLDVLKTRQQTSTDVRMTWRETFTDVWRKEPRLLLRGLVSRANYIALSGGLFISIYGFLSPKVQRLLETEAGGQAGG
eukprot:CAMPEP_0184351142 /NCGR_PEP_ID=MMETSP1089-20130417/43427_1 /TAXON_ID=38269 ORGANISM="Gloeochaete wittrockiana, Strain SAG46.84" /NCGR_SAMPLE_ID=MMETSP1089 /ASSEMBLY_ACC=CAM_ASM_000445 /LENGTH=308 /DNA_ID=CAMNT_0026684393 /DNA_START=134 /DNA_END=1057 /DNA_ORIENTATION=-